MPAIQTRSDANFRSSTYFIARTRGRCPHCGLSTGLLALVLPRGHQALHADADAVADAGAEDDAGNDMTAPGAWQRADIGAFLFYVERLPDDVQGQLNPHSRFFRPVHSKATLNSYWANHCEHCSRPLDDHELHCEPDGAFMPVSAAAAEAIELLEIPQPFEAVAAGYALEPEFFEFMRRSRPSWPSTF
jgi:hypothetical protein